MLTFRQFGSQKTWIKTLHFLGIVASLVLIASISIETFNHDPFLKRSIYFDIQFWICIYFTCDFFIFLFISKNKKKSLSKNTRLSFCYLFRI